MAATERPAASTVRRLDISSDGRARKALLALRDGKTIETVLLRPHPNRFTACISSQAGCAVACTFCATGLMGFERDLSPEEIAGQVVFWKRYLKENALESRFFNVVYMGMGEPFACYEAVAESLRLLMDPKGPGLGPARIAVSTAGIAPRIVAFGRDFPRVRLALSLHAANDALRTRLVPLNKAYDLAKLAAAVSTYLQETGRKVFFEYVLLQGENDRSEDADDLARWLEGLGPRELLHVNLIVFNPTDTPHRPSSEADARRFQRDVLARGFKATVRQNLGQDIAGACGQLAVLESANAAGSLRDVP